MARVLIVGCGCRGRALASALAADGHVVRGTTRAEASLPEIRAAGAEGALADPDRLGTLLPLLEGVTVVCWLMATAAAPQLHGDRLRSLIETLVDTPARGFVYEDGVGRELARSACGTRRIPFALIDADPADHVAWLASGRSAVDQVLWHPSAPR